MSAPNPDCPVCSVAQARILVDMSRVTLEDLVEKFLKVHLGYGEELVVNHDSNLLFDFEETDNVTKKFSDLGNLLLIVCYTVLMVFNPIGIKHDSFLTIIDEDDENPKVNLILSVQESS